MMVKALCLMHYDSESCVLFSSTVARPQHDLILQILSVLLLLKVGTDAVTAVVLVPVVASLSITGNPALLTSLLVLDMPKQPNTPQIVLT